MSLVIILTWYRSTVSILRDDDPNTTAVALQSPRENGLTESFVQSVNETNWVMIVVIIFTVSIFEIVYRFIKRPVHDGTAQQHDMQQPEEPAQAQQTPRASSRHNLRQRRSPTPAQQQPVQQQQQQEQEQEQQQQQQDDGGLSLQVFSDEQNGSRQLRSSKLPPNARKVSVKEQITRSAECLLR